MNILVFDNYDSFTGNITHLIEKITGAAPVVVMNDIFDPADASAFDAIVISPGPGLPREAGGLMDLIATCAPTKPMLGVCLGHQAIGEHFGARLLNSGEIRHGVATPVHQAAPSSFLFKGLPDVFDAGRYHSWHIDAESFPESLRITAKDDDGVIMAMEHRNLPIASVQFHPESILTPYGEQIIANWLAHLKS